ncbi:MAG: hypothetical protein RLZZ447_1606 [Verrucomicrobiota bacterium]|jgi:prepilin-type N-terminal cleavage/methylation domain-containing protein
MITSTRWPARKHRRGFTLAEILVALGLSAGVLGAILTSFIFLTRTGLRVELYNDMERQARAALELFARDTREASAITWNSVHSVTLIVDSRTITYSHTAGSFTRTDNSGAKVLITGITHFAFKGYSITGAELPSIGTTTSLANAAAWTKQLQISLQSSRAPGDTATATHQVLSARYILRNKRVTA